MKIIDFTHKIEVTFGILSRKMITNCFVGLKLNKYYHFFRPYGHGYIKSNKNPCFPGPDKGDFRRKLRIWRKNQPNSYRFKQAVCCAVKMSKNSLGGRHLYLLTVVAQFQNMCHAFVVCKTEKNKPYSFIVRSTGTMKASFLTSRN